MFRTLYEARFPFEELRVTARSELDAHPTGDGNNTESFVCRPSTGSTTTFSQHAYGLAIDLDPFQNPYTERTTWCSPSWRRPTSTATTSGPG